ncbi:hypothetical protein BGZ82_011060 [Podila clonocystis]|nr:hypothetical protein BGZ82_011060 [Podila clonocystis]
MCGTQIPADPTIHVIPTRQVSRNIICTTLGRITSLEETVTIATTHSVKIGLSVEVSTKPLAWECRSRPWVNAKHTVLVGDACHKLISFSGIGSVHAIMDCITLMNALFDKPDGDQFTATDIPKAFRPTAPCTTSTLNELICKGTVRGMPQYLISVAVDRIFASRPIPIYLPFVPDYCPRKSDPQPLGRHDREELKLLQARQRIERLNQSKAKSSALSTTQGQGNRLSVGGILRSAPKGSCSLP